MALVGSPSMPTFEELDSLTSKELHDRATKLARRRADLKWMWDLMRTIPEAEVAAGDDERAFEDQWHVFTLLIHDTRHADEGKLADALRPVYIDYLMKHEKD
jgi:hypothetical protein